MNKDTSPSQLTDHIAAFGHWRVHEPALTRLICAAIALNAAKAK